MQRTYIRASEEVHNKRAEIYNHYTKAINESEFPHSTISDFLTLKVELKSRLSHNENSLITALVVFTQTINDNDEVSNLSKETINKINYALRADSHLTLELFFREYNSLPQGQREYLKILADNLVIKDFFDEFHMSKYPALLKYSIFPGQIINLGNAVIINEAHLIPLTYITDKYFEKFQLKFDYWNDLSKEDKEEVQKASEPVGRKEKKGFEQPVIDSIIIDFLEGQESKKTKYWKVTDGPLRGSIIVNELAEYILFDELEKTEDDISLKTIENRINNCEFIKSYLPSTKRIENQKKEK